MLSKQKRNDLEKQGYRFVGSHSAVKVCQWTKEAIRGRAVCYKCAFYGIASWRCVQMTPALPFCNQRCVWCWRDIEHTLREWSGPVDRPADIIDGCIREHVRLLIGFKGAKSIDFERFEQAQKPKHFAISLAGEPTLYPKIGELIAELRRRGISSFLVTNGTRPDVLLRLRKKAEPTQLYITLHAPNKQIYEMCCRPLITDGWERLIESLGVLEKLRCRKVLRLTLVKGMNMVKPQSYAKLIEMADTDFVEFKAYMWVGYSRQRLNKEAMPSYSEVLDFAKKVCELAGLELVDSSERSRVVLARKSSMRLKISDASYICDD